MNFNEILKEYDQSREVLYADDYYNDSRKKLQVAFECLGLYDLTVFKSTNGKDYSFVDERKDYVFHLLDMETSPLFRNIKGGKMTMENYVEIVDEVEKLFDFIKAHVVSEQEYNTIISEISANVRYPLLKRYAESQQVFYSWMTYYEGLIKDEGYITAIPYWWDLTADDKVRLLDEMIIATRKWVDLLERLGEYRSDEMIEAYMQVSIDGMETYILVEDAIQETYLEAYKLLPQPSVAKSRNLKSKVSKYMRHEESACKLKLDLAKEYCENCGIDFQKYLQGKELADEFECSRVPTEKAIEEILN